MFTFNDKKDREIQVCRFEEKDAADLLEYYRAETHVVTMNERFCGPLTEQAVKQHIAGSQENCIFLCIRAEGRVIGFVRFDRLTGTFCKSAEISFGLLYDYWRNKILEVVISHAVDYVFKNYDIVRIFYENYSRDLGSCYILMDCGFQRDGVLRSCAYNSGIMSDVTIFSLLFSDVRPIITVKK